MPASECLPLNAKKKKKTTPAPQIEINRMLTDIQHVIGMALVICLLAAFNTTGRT